jgi:hypothetical protein
VVVEGKIHWSRAVKTASSVLGGNRISVLEATRAGAPGSKGARSETVVHPSSPGVLLQHRMIRLSVGVCVCVCVRVCVVDGGIASSLQLHQQDNGGGLGWLASVDWTRKMGAQDRSTSE